MTSLTLLGVVAAAGCGAGPVSAESRAELQLVYQTNVLRKHDGRKMLMVNRLLERAARARASAMARRDRVTRPGAGPDAAARAAGYDPALVGEVVARIQAAEDPAGLVAEAWKRSTGHRKTLLAPEFTEIGAGAAQSRSGRWYFCLVLGRPAAEARPVAGRVTVENRTRYTIPVRLGDQVQVLRPRETLDYRAPSAAGSVRYGIRWPALPGNPESGGPEAGYVPARGRYRLIGSPTDFALVRVRD